MKGAWIVFRREIAQYFATPFAYVVGAALLLVTALLFNNDLVASIGIKPANPAVVPSFLQIAMVFFAPLLTMRLLAEEKREGTLELLLTAPVRDGEIVVGKFFGAWAFYTLLLALTFLYQIILVTVATPDFGHAVSAYLGIWLYGGATLSVGLLFSALTENQIVAAFLGTTALIFFWLGELAGQVISNIDVARVVRELTLPGHITDSFAVGVVRAEDVAYFAGIIAVMIFITIRVVESHRWR
jgi:ABC-2 type transport system permease protein